MDIYLLRYFLAVVETGSFTKAAASCLITQPTLSQGIKRLEDSVGAPLFVRNNKRVFLTSEGVRFLPRAKAILNECNLALSEIRAETQTLSLRLGILSTLSSVWVGRLIKGFRAHHSGVRFELTEGSEQEISNRLDERSLDYALSIRRVAEDACIDIYAEAYSLALSSQHELAAQNVIRGEDLADQPMIVRTRCEVLSETSRHFTDRNVRPPLVYRTGFDERALEMVAADLGVTLMPDSYHHDEVVRIPLSGFDYRRQIALFLPRFRLSENLAPMGEAFVRFCQTL